VFFILLLLPDGGYICSEKLKLAAGDLIALLAAWRGLFGRLDEAQCETGRRGLVKAKYIG